MSRSLFVFQLPDSTVSPDEAADTARSVVSGRAYVEAARPPSLQERAFDWLAERVADLIAALSSGGGRGVIAWLIVALFLSAIGFLLFRLLGRYEPLAKAERPPDPEIEIFALKSADEWLARAAEQEVTGQWRLGLRSRHRALVATLVDRGLIDPRPGMTASALSLQASAEHHSIGPPMAAATQLFEAVWYGTRSAGPDERDQFQTLADQVATDLEHLSARVRS